MTFTSMTHPYGQCQILTQLSDLCAIPDSLALIPSLLLQEGPQEVCVQEYCHYRVTLNCSHSLQQEILCKTDNEMKLCLFYQLLSSAPASSLCYRHDLLSFPGHCPVISPRIQGPGMMIQNPHHSWTFGSPEPPGMHVFWLGASSVIAGAPGWPQRQRGQSRDTQPAAQLLPVHNSVTPLEPQSLSWLLPSPLHH